MRVVLNVDGEFIVSLAARQMASLNRCLASLARLSLTTPARPTTAPLIPKFLLPTTTVPLVRYASGGGGGMRKRPPKKKKTYKTFRSYDLSPMEQFSLCDAMRYAHVLNSPPGVVPLTFCLATSAPSKSAGRPLSLNTSFISSLKHTKAAPLFGTEFVFLSLSKPTRASALSVPRTAP